MNIDIINVFDTVDEFIAAKRNIIIIEISVLTIKVIYSIIHLIIRKIRTQRFDNIIDVVPMIDIIIIKDILINLRNNI